MATPITRHQLRDRFQTLFGLDLLLTWSDQSDR